ncbi:MAG: stage II sporulation protein P [Lachnospiraceae bacterium]|nr:stage II sporulation protein P [Lachnospiraceae bacterium]MDY4769564.1 stage II sporulation protein P [Lachnospiraceae bacterium]
MTKGQKAICILLCLCMIGMLTMRFLMSVSVRKEQDCSRGFLTEIIPLLAYCQGKEKQEPLTEDEQTYAAILEANQVYLEEQVAEENDQKQQEEKQTKTQEKEEEEMPQEEVQEEAQETVAEFPLLEEIPREKLENYEYLLGNFFIVDPNTVAGSDLINAESLMGREMRLSDDQESPQILIYHSHSQETYADSRAGNPEDTVVGVGEVLCSLLQENYGFGVIHVTDTFDVVNGAIDRSSAYDYARETVEQVLEEHPSVEVVIDLHRDGVAEDRHLVTEVNGKPTAQIMFFNGLSYSAQNGAIAYLPNPNIAENLAFSFQMELVSKEYFPGLCRAVYLSSLRYNLHLKPRAALIEVGAQTNTVEEAKNAMIPLSWILNKVLKGQ